MDYDLTNFASAIVRLLAAVVLAGMVGLEREFHGRWAGLRTHMAVAMGAAVFVIVGTEIAPAPSTDITRIVQGIAAGIGFLGAGTILKLSDQLEVKGLTTASSIWLSAALGTAAGLGLYVLAIATTIVALAVLALLRPMEKWLVKNRK
jgi:putative Mg2+ transporter-C (MgtC) family protein